MTTLLDLALEQVGQATSQYLLRTSRRPKPNRLYRLLNEQLRRRRRDFKRQHRIGFGTNAAARRAKRGVFKALPPMRVWANSKGDWRPLSPVVSVHSDHGRITALLADGTYWRLFMRGGKTFRRRLKAGYPTLNPLPAIDWSAVLRGEI